MVRLSPISSQSVWRALLTIFPNRRGGFWLSAAEQYWKIEMLKWFRVRAWLFRSQTCSVFRVY